jgi:hypothetical protein
MLNGVAAKEYELTTRIQNMANKAAAAARNILMIQSPSKVFLQIGEYVSLGLAEGIASKAQNVENAIGNIANDLKTTEFTLNDVHMNVGRLPIDKFVGNTETFNSTISNHVEPRIELHMHYEAGVNQSNDLANMARMMADKTMYALRSKGVTVLGLAGN